MEKINLQFFYELGAQLNPLTKFTPEVKNRVGIWLASFPAHQYAYAILNSTVTLKVCRGTGIELTDVISKMQKWMSDRQPAQWADVDVQANILFTNVINKAKQFETVLNAELQTLATYHVTQKGIYATTDLIERAEYILPASVLSKISQEVKEEIKQSGRCLALDSGTACAFHMMRAVEAVMHEYYIAVCKPKPKSQKRLENWGAYIACFQKSTTAEVKEVVAMLQQIKDRHRNLIMHPEMVLTPEEAFTLFEVAKGAIVIMADHLPKPKEKKAIALKDSKAIALTDNKVQAI
jgi:hypothetical protein